MLKLKALAASVLPEAENRVYRYTKCIATTVHFTYRTNQKPLRSSRINPKLPTTCATQAMRSISLDQESKTPKNYVQRPSSSRVTPLCILHGLFPIRFPNEESLDDAQPTLPSVFKCRTKEMSQGGDSHKKRHSRPSPKALETPSESKTRAKRNR